MSILAGHPGLITREGHERLRAELDRLLQDQLGVAEADERIAELRATLARARIADPPEKGVVGIGQRVRIRLAEGAPPREYRLVGALEADATRGELSVDSPIGRALVGRRAGEVVEAETPGGARVVELLAVG